MQAIQQTIKLDAERDRSFPADIMQSPGCEKLEACFQCGTCSGVCPLSIYMDYTPRRIVYLTRAGFKRDVLKSNTIWLCASCYACTVDCPKGIHITDIMYALKQRAIRDNVYPRGFPIPVLAREFFKMVRSSGRTSESWLVIRLMLNTNIFKLFGMTKLGLNLMRTGRFSLKTESIRRPAELRKMLDAAKSE
jgi:quinone-modifying oxidoreductase, subunit QmoC